MTREKTLREKMEYCHKNPVTRGLVAGAHEWRWSSYRYYEFADQSVLPMDWDGRWPIVWRAVEAIALVKSVPQVADATWATRPNWSNW